MIDYKRTQPAEGVIACVMVDAVGVMFDMLQLVGEIGKIEAGFMNAVSSLSASPKIERHSCDKSTFGSRHGSVPRIDDKLKHIGHSERSNK